MYIFQGDAVKMITIFGSLFTFGMVPLDEAAIKKDAANITFTELDIAKQDSLICKRKHNRQMQFKKDLKNDDIYKLFQSMSLTNIYNRIFNFK